MLFSYPAISQVFFLLISIFFAIILLILIAPFGLSLDLGKKENLACGSIKLTWLFLTIIKREVSPQSIEELLASIGREKNGMDGIDVKEGKERNNGNNETDGNGGVDEQDAGEMRAGAKENAFISLIRRLGKKKIIDDRTDGSIAEKTETSGKARKARRCPGIRSLINAAPAMAELLGDLGRSIRIKKFSCRLCFGLNDPAQTAIISGYIWFFASALGVSLADMVLEPWFYGLRLEGRLEAEIRARLISPIWAAVKSLRRKEIRRLVGEILGWS